MDMYKYIILTVVVVALGGIAWYITQTPKTSTVSTYTNVAYGISFKYPNTYELQEREVGNGERYHTAITLADKEALANTPRFSEGPPTINIDIFQNNLDQLEVEEWIRGTNDSNYKLSPDGVLTPITIGGEPALWYEVDGLYRMRTIVLAHKDNILMLSVGSFSLEDQIRKDFDNLLASVDLF
jgi:hypothetical protein